jgi:hypothetical protein
VDDTFPSFSNPLLAFGGKKPVVQLQKHKIFAFLFGEGEIESTLEDRPILILRTVFPRKLCCGGTDVSVNGFS